MGIIIFAAYFFFDHLSVLSTIFIFDWMEYMDEVDDSDDGREYIVKREGILLQCKYY